MSKVTTEELQPMIDWLVSMQAPLPTRVIETVFYPGGSYELDTLVFNKNNARVASTTEEFVKNPTTALIDLIHAGVVQMNVHAVVPYKAPDTSVLPPPNPTGDLKGRIGQERLQSAGVSFSPRRFDKLGYAPLGTTYITSTGGIYVSHAGENPFSPEYWLEAKAPSS